MEAKTYYEKTLSNNDPIFDEARRIGGSLCKAVGKATWFVKDYLQCFLFCSASFLIYCLLRRKKTQRLGKEA